MRTPVAVLLASLFVSTLPAHAAPGWAINEDLRFNLTYLPSTPAGAGPGRPAARPLLAHVPVFAPDISNIIYQGLLDLGFPLPRIKTADRTKLLLKLYAFPSGLSASLSSRRALDPFLIALLPAGETIYRFAADPAHLAIKHAVVAPAERAFDERHPLPPFTLAGRTGSAAQELLDGSVPFTSLYLTPSSPGAARGSEAERAIASSAGVVAFHRDLLAAYRRALLELPRTAKAHRFAHVTRCPGEPSRACGLRLLEVPAAPLRFASYRELPMPHAPELFLSGLLLLKVTDLSLAGEPLFLERIASLKAAELEAKAPVTFAQVLEIGSVFSTKR